MAETKKQESRDGWLTRSLYTTEERMDKIDSMIESAIGRGAGRSLSRSSIINLAIDEYIATHRGKVPKDHW